MKRLFTLAFTLSCAIVQAEPVDVASVVVPQGLKYEIIRAIGDRYYDGSKQDPVHPEPDPFARGETLYKGQVTDKTIWFRVPEIGFSQGFTRTLIPAGVEIGGISDLMPIGFFVSSDRARVCLAIVEGRGFMLYGYKREPDGSWTAEAQTELVKTTSQQTIEGFEFVRLDGRAAEIAKMAGPGVIALAKIGRGTGASAIRGWSYQDGEIQALAEATTKAINEVFRVRLLDVARKANSKRE